MRERSIPERSESKIYNTCPCFNENGYIGKFRKMHLFDVDIKDRMVFHESESLSPGKNPVILEHDKWKVGLGICYDVRFQEFGEYYVQNGCNILIYPSAFNLTTGPAHWELMARARAVQSQCYVAMCSPARNTSADYVAWGYSMVVDPW
uniref:omega-amidase n=1 Tax=Romanomermis culicivorax TaxID=13658 RepID=A0A915K1Y2_ROMCU